MRVIFLIYRQIGGVPQVIAGTGAFQFGVGKFAGMRVINQVNQALSRRFICLVRVDDDMGMVPRIDGYLGTEVVLVGPDDALSYPAVSEIGIVNSHRICRKPAIAPLIVPYDVWMPLRIDRQVRPRRIVSALIMVIGNLDRGGPAGAEVGGIKNVCVPACLLLPDRMGVAVDIDNQLRIEIVPGLRRRRQPPGIGPASAVVGHVIGLQYALAVLPLPHRMDIAAGVYLYLWITVVARIWGDLPRGCPRLGRGRYGGKGYYE